MAGDWIKVRKVLFTHPKVIRISSAVGFDEVTTVGWLMKLWAWADDATADGNVIGVTLCNVASVTGALPEFLEAMQLVGWLVEDEDGIVFPDYEEHMSNSAKKRGITRKRVQKHRENECNAPSVTKALPEKRREEYVEQKDGTSEVVEYYQTLHPKSKPGAKVRKKIRDRLTEGYSLEDLKNAIDGNHLSPHHCGQNDTGTKYHSLELIVRDSSHVDQFLEVFHNPPRGPTATTNAQRKLTNTQQAIEGFLNAGDGQDAIHQGHDDAGGDVLTRADGTAVGGVLAGVTRRGN